MADGGDSICCGDVCVQSKMADGGDKIVCGDVCVQPKIADGGEADWWTDMTPEPQPDPSTKRKVARHKKQTKGNRGMHKSQSP